MEVETGIDLFINSFIFFEDTNVLMINNDIIGSGEDTYIFKRINSLMSSCFKGLQLDEYFSGANKTLSLYSVDPSLGYTPPKTVKEFDNIIKNNTRYVTSYAILLLDRDYVEVWNMCTAPESRQMGYSGEILLTLDLLQDNLERLNWKFTKFWLVVEVNNTTMTKLLKHYARYGFENPCITKYTSDAMTIIDTSGRSDYIAMTKFTRQNPLSFKRIFCYFDEEFMERYTQEIIPSHAECILEIYNNQNIPLFLDPLSFRHIFNNYLGYDDANPTLPTFENEHGGSFMITNITKPGERYNLLYVDYTSIVQGDFDRVKLNVVTNIIFHTHPKKATMHYKLPVAWPSVPDLIIATKCRNNIFVNLVFAMEGVYFYEVSKELKDFLNKIPIYDQISFISQEIYEYTKKFEKHTFAVKGIESYNIQEYLNQINTTPINFNYTDPFGVTQLYSIVPFIMRFVPREEFFKSTVPSLTIQQIFS